MRVPEVVIIGSGNVATHLLEALCGADVPCGLWSRNIAGARNLAGRCRGKSVAVYESLADIPRDSSYYIIAVSDRAVDEVTEALGRVGGIIAHTSGSVPMYRGAEGAGYGVFYPLQTFSADTPVDITEVPFFIEGTSCDVSDRLASLVRRIGAVPYFADSVHRARLHLAAVFACNFANSLWGVSQRILADAGYPLTVLKPLLEETMRKAMAIGPCQAQTGPAKRGDLNVINRQMSELSDGPELNAYRDLTELIICQQKMLGTNNKSYE